MKHCTCDKCGFPTKNNGNIVLNDRRYDFCDQCHGDIFKGLENKGNRIEFCNILSHNKSSAYDRLYDKC